VFVCDERSVEPDGPKASPRQSQCCGGDSGCDFSKDPARDVAPFLGNKIFHINTLAGI